MSADSRSTPAPLDLRAVEARLNVALTTGDRSYDRHIQADQRALLAHCRALRAALVERSTLCRDIVARMQPETVVSHPDGNGRWVFWLTSAQVADLQDAPERAAAVLAQATDGNQE